MTSTTQNTTVGQSTAQMITTWLAVVVSFRINPLIHEDICCAHKRKNICGGQLCSRIHAQVECARVFGWRVCVLAGLEMAWVQRPPEKVTNGEEFNVSYTVTASDSFYDYAVRNRIFQFRWAPLVGSAWSLSALPDKSTTTFTDKRPEQIPPPPKVSGFCTF